MARPVKRTSIPAATTKRCFKCLTDPDGHSVAGAHPSASAFTSTAGPKAKPAAEPREFHFPAGALKDLPARVSVDHPELNQNRGGRGPTWLKDCLHATMHIVRKTGSRPGDMRPEHHFFTMVEPRTTTGHFGSLPFDRHPTRKRAGRHASAEPRTVWAGLNYMLCMLQAGYIVPVGVSYFNNRQVKNEADHWMLVHGFEKTILTDGTVTLQLIAHDVGIINNHKKNEPDERHVRFIITEDGQILKPGKHNLRTQVRGGYTLTVIGVPFPIGDLLPQT